jgi:hypothetical protein
MRKGGMRRKRRQIKNLFVKIVWGGAKLKKKLSLLDFTRMERF